MCLDFLNRLKTCCHYLSRCTRYSDAPKKSSVTVHPIADRVHYVRGSSPKQRERLALSLAASNSPERSPGIRSSDALREKKTDGISMVEYINRFRESKPLDKTCVDITYHTYDVF